MDKDVRNFVWSCDTCQRNKARNQTVDGLLQPILVPKHRWEQITLDLITELLQTSRGYTTVVVFVDRLTKLLYFAQIHDTVTAADHAHIYVDRIFRHHGLSRIFILNRDP